MVNAILDDVAKTKQNTLLSCETDDEKSNETDARSEHDDTTTFRNNYMLPLLTWFEHGKSTKELYEILINPCVYDKLPNDIRDNCDKDYSLVDETLQDVLIDTVVRAW